MDTPLDLPRIPQGRPDWRPRSILNFLVSCDLVPGKEGPTTHSNEASLDVNLRLIWPQWQGGGTPSVQEYASEFPFDVASRGYAVGSAVLQAVLPPHDGPTLTVPVTMTDEGLAERDGVEAKTIVIEQLARALKIIRQLNPARIATLGGECSVSVAPFSALAGRYGDDLAIIWIDSHPDVGTGDSEYPGYHAMAVSALTGQGDLEVQAVLPATVSSDRVALVGLHSWADDDYAHVTDCGLQSSAPTSCVSRARRSSCGWHVPAALGWRFTSMSTPSTATRSCWASAPSLTA
jgi:hypothetical protein